MTEDDRKISKSAVCAINWHLQVVFPFMISKIVRQRSLMYRCLISRNAIRTLYHSWEGIEFALDWKRSEALKQEGKEEHSRIGRCYESFR